LKQYKIEEMGNFLMAANETLKKTEVYSGNKASSERFVECFINKRWRFSCNKKSNNPLLDKIIAQGGGPVLGLFSPKDTATVNGYFKDKKLETVSRPALCEIPLGKIDNNKRG
jgi:SecD/SecF fusion protein